MNRNMLKFVALICVAVLPIVASAVTVEWTSSTDAHRWQHGGKVEVAQFNNDEVYDIMITRYKQQMMMGWGGCFGELGWDALQLLDKRDRDKVMRDLFGKDGAALGYNRTPIGANDFARDWYSLDDVTGDYALEHFSIERDKSGLIPYIKSALKVNPHMKLWACPWSPPEWMKTNGSYANKKAPNNNVVYEVPGGDHDQVFQFHKNLDALARYLCRYVTAYKAEGVNIGMIMFQNEPYTFNIWPNTSWKPSSIATFIGRYLGPRLEVEHPNVQLWHGTLNTDRITDVQLVMNDVEASRYLDGMGFQWEGKDICYPLHLQYPGKPVMCTENECGDGKFNWAGAEHTWWLIKAYIEGGCGIYTYFNMVLKDAGTSSWGWNQNTLIRVLSATRKAEYTPEFYLMKHFGHFVEEGSYKLKVMGNDWDSLAFVRPDGKIVVFVANCEDSAREKSVAWRDKVYRFKMQPRSFNTIIISE